MSESPAEPPTGVGTLRWSVCPGRGRVAHAGSAVAVVAPSSETQAAFADRLIAAVDAASAAAPGSATALFRELSGLVIDTRADAVAPFGVVADDDGRLAVLLCGAVDLEAVRAGGEREHLSGAEAATYVDRRIDGPVEQLRLAAAGAPAADAGSDLRLGVVAGAGLAAVPRTAAAAVGRPAVAEAPTIGTRAPAAAASPPVGSFAAAVMAPPASTPSAPHSAPAPSGTATAAASGPRNVVLSLQGMPAVELLRDVIVGRQPATAPDVVAGTADPFAVTDPSVSRVHARLTINSEGVWLTDLAAANGTRVLPPDATSWQVITPHTMTAVRPGTRILFGGCEAQCDFTPAGSRAVPEALVVVARDAAAAAGPAGGIADYAFVRSLGESYHGELYLAVPPARLGLDVEFVVVKVISGVTSDDAFARAVRELRAYASVESPYLLTVHDAGNDAGRFFYSMPYLRRGSLATAADSLPAAAIMTAVAQAAKATHALHEAGMLHLGIAPSSILLGDENAYLSDVGATQSIVREQTLSGMSSLQHVEFLEPPILLGERGTPASDIWSLGATLYRMLARTSIYGAFPDEPLPAIRMVLTSKPTLPVLLDEPVLDVVRRCVDADEGRRFTTAADVAAAIESAVGA